MSEGPVLARVAVPVPLGQAFTYAVPEAMLGQVQRGSRVLCGFGRRQVLGVVIDVGAGVAPIDPAKLKPIRAVVETEPVFSAELLDFLLEVARYYLAPIGEVMRLALPSVERSAAQSLGQQGLLEPSAIKAVGRVVQIVTATSSGDDSALPRGRAPELLAFVREQGSCPVASLEERWSNARSIVKRLAALNLVQLESRQQSADPFFAAPVARDTPPELNAAQREAVDAIVAAITAGERRPFLLHGVTASGKTEVYLHAVKAAVERGGSAIVLVPEIALTPQLVGRFRARIGDAIAVLHSGLSDKERHGMWKRLRSGELRVAVGARSALFAPVERLALVCVDEEHDGSFKQEEGVRYQARDMALLRTHRAQAVCVLGSATPSLESEMRVREGRLTRLRLPERARKAAAMPQVQIVDLRRVGAGPTQNKLITLPLHRELERVLEAKEQAILFLNRRGFAPSIVCDGCGQIVECPNCSVALTLHRSRGDRLHCHYCDYATEVPKLCPKCRSDRLEQEGSGTERIEETLAQAFPAARVARLDRDVASGAKSERILSAMREREVDVLVGTQMVTKGHDLPNVTLVGVLNADAALSMPDFRAAERTFHLLVQVAGRAGRAETPGKVLIQTRDPDAYAVAYARRHDVDGFVERELSEREELGYPPFSRMALVKVDALEQELAERECERLAGVARRAAPPGTQVLGPAAAPLARLRNRYRYRFMLRTKDRAALRTALLAVARTAADRRVRVAIDVDPMTML